MLFGQCVEKSRSWSSAHDWKSCNRQKRFEGSNPSFSATSSQASYRLRRRFFFQNDCRLALIPLLLLSKIEPTSLGFNFVLSRDHSPNAVRTLTPRRRNGVRSVPALFFAFLRASCLPDGEADDGLPLFRGHPPRVGHVYLMVQPGLCEVRGIALFLQICLHQGDGPRLVVKGGPGASPARTAPPPR